MKRSDLLIYLVIILMACLLLFAAPESNNGTMIIISTPNETYKYSLEQERTVTVSSGDYALTVMIENGNVRVASANCPDLVCVHTGPIDQDRSVILCVPARIQISVLAKGGTLDGIVY